MTPDGLLHVPGFAAGINLRDVDAGVQWVNPTGRRGECFMASVRVGYTYSGRTYMARPVTELVRQLGERINREIVTDSPGLNCCFLNRYSDHHGLDWHADDEPNMSHGSPIVTVSLGSKRTFSVKPKRATTNVHSFDLSHGDLLVMPPGFQKRWLHRVEVGTPFDLRVSLTYRRWSRSA